MTYQTIIRDVLMVGAGDAGMRVEIGTPLIEVPAFRW